MALDFASGSLDYGDLAAYDMDGAEAMTISALVYLDTKPTGGGVNNALVGKYAASQEQYLLYLTGDGTNSDLAGIVETPTSYYVGPGEFHTLNTGEWAHVALVYDKAASAGTRQLLYVNSTAVFTSTSTDGQAVLTAKTSALILGSFSGGNYLDGKLADVAIWNVALSGANISTIYNSGSFKSPLYVPTGLVFYARLTSTAADDDEINSVSPTATNVSDFTHPTVQYPSSSILPLVTGGTDMARLDDMRG